MCKYKVTQLMNYLNSAENLEVGDKLTMDGLKVCEVINTDATRGLGGTQDGFELRDVDKDGEDNTFFKTGRQIELRWRKLN